MASIRANFLIFILPIVAISCIFLATTLTMVSISRLEEQSLEEINSANDYLQKNINNWLSFQTNVISSLGDISSKSNGINPITHLDSNILESIKSELGFRNVALVDENGKARLSGNLSRVGADYSNLDYINNARKNAGNIIISDVRFSRVDGTPLISFAKTLKSGDTIFTSVPLKNLYKDYVETTRDQKFNYSFILTASCELLAHPSLDKGTTPTVDYKQLCSNPSISSFEEDGESYTVSVSQNPLTKWYVVTAVNKKSINGIVSDVVKTAVLISLIVLFIVIVTVILLTGSMAKRMSKIVTMIDLASAGDIEELELQKDQLKELASKRDEIGKIACATQLLIHSQEKKLRLLKQLLMVI